MEIKELGNLAEVGSSQLALPSLDRQFQLGKAMNYHTNSSVSKRPQMLVRPSWGRGRRRPGSKGLRA